jgi:hypothetical protein
MPDVAARRTAPVADGASLPGMSEVFVIEAADLDGEAAGSSEDVLSAAVTWPDGRTDMLPHSCADWDVDPDDIIKDRPFLHFGWSNVLAGMVGGYGSEDLGRLGPDVFYSRTGDVTGASESFTHYLRGEFGAVIQKWLADMVGYDTPTSFPWDALVLCSHYGLLADLPRNGSYEVNFFYLTPDEDQWGLVIDFDHGLPETEISILVQMFEAAGCTWPRSVAEGDEKATAAWEKRIGD